MKLICVALLISVMHPANLSAGEINKKYIEIEKHLIENRYHRDKVKISLADLKLELSRDENLKSKVNLYDTLQVLGYGSMFVGATVGFIPAVSKVSRTPLLNGAAILGILQGAGLIVFSNHVLGKAVEQYNAGLKSPSPIQPVINHEVDENQDEKTSIGIKIGF